MGLLQLRWDDVNRGTSLKKKATPKLKTQRARLTAFTKTRDRHTTLSC